MYAGSFRAIECYGYYDIRPKEKIGQLKIFTVKLSMVIGRTEGVLPVLLHTKTRREHSQSSSDLSPFSSHRVPKKSTHNSFNLSGQRFCAAAVAAALHYTEGEVHQSCFNPLLTKKGQVCLYVITFFSCFKIITLSDSEIGKFSYVDKSQTNSAKGTGAFEYLGTCSHRVLADMLTLFLSEDRLHTPQKD